MKKLNLINKILVSFLLIFGFILSYSFNLYYPFGHLDLFSSGYILIELLKISGFLLLPLGIYYNHKTSRNISKLLFPIICTLSLILNTSIFFSLNKNSLPFPNSNNLDLETIEIYNEINQFIPKYIINSLFIIINLLMIISSIIVFIEDKYETNDLKSFVYLPLVILLTLPLNIFATFVSKLSTNTYSIIRFDNFTIWHFLMFILLICITLLTYSYLKKKDYDTQVLYLRALAIVMMIHYFSKDSLVIGDGYNVYNLVFSTIPFFICDIGKFIVVLALFTKKKVFYDIAYFVHSAGALTVFFYFGKTGTHNYGTILSYSYLYFVLTHLLLFMLSVLPVMLKHTSFKFKDVKIPIIYYGVVILISTFTSVGITNLMANYIDSNGNSLNFIYLPNYAFTQICPLPVIFPTFMNIKIGICEVNFFYEIVLYIAYICIFFAFYIFQYFAPKGVKYLKLKLFKS